MWTLTFAQGNMFRLSVGGGGGSLICKKWFAKRK